MSMQEIHCTMGASTAFMSDGRQPEVDVLGGGLVETLR